MRASVTAAVSDRPVLRALLEPLRNDGFGLFGAKAGLPRDGWRQKPAACQLRIQQRCQLLAEHADPGKVPKKEIATEVEWWRRVDATNQPNS
jgi:hypothetical protein